jgi:HlyD family secretion protein
MFRKYFLPILALIGFYSAVSTVLTTMKKPVVAPAISEPAKVSYAHYVAGAGITEANTENISIAPSVGGVIAQIFVKIGDSVKKGDPLFQIDSRDIDAELLVREASLKVALADLERSEKLFDFWNSIADKRAVSAEEMVRKKFDVNTAKAAYERAAAQVAASKIELERRIIRSPIDGSILQIKGRLGEFSPAQQLATPVMLLGSITPLNVRIDVDENDAWRITPGTKGKAFVRGNSELSVPIEFVRIEPYVLPKKSLTGDSGERVDTRVLQLIYRVVEPAGDKTVSLYVGQLMDVYLESES